MFSPVVTVLSGVPVHFILCVHVSLYNSLSLLSRHSTHSSEEAGFTDPSLLENLQSNHVSNVRVPRRPPAVQDQMEKVFESNCVHLLDVSLFKEDPSTTVAVRLLVSVMTCYLLCDLDSDLEFASSISLIQIALRGCVFSQDIVMNVRQANRLISCF